MCNRCILHPKMTELKAEINSGKNMKRLIHLKNKLSKGLRTMFCSLCNSRKKERKKERKKDDHIRGPFNKQTVVWEWESLLN